MSDKDISSWEKRLMDQVSRDWHNYGRYRIDLSIARDRLFWNYAGEFMVIEEVSSASAAASIRLNRNTNDAIDLNVGTIIKTVFKEFYITNAIQSGEWIDVVIGINFEYYKRFAGNGPASADAQPCIIVTNASADTDTQAAAHVCNRVLIKAHHANTDLVWIDFGQAAVENAGFDLPADHSLSVPLSNTDRVHALFKVADERITICYEV